MNYLNQKDFSGQRSGRDEAFSVCRKRIESQESDVDLPMRLRAPNTPISTSIELKESEPNCGCGRISKLKKS